MEIIGLFGLSGNLAMFQAKLMEAPRLKIQASFSGLKFHLTRHT